MKIGTLKQNGVHLKEHEYTTVKLLLEQGYDIELIPPSQIKGLHMPDLMLQGIPWELKSPTGNGRKTIENTIQTAAKQSGNVIIDLRRIKMPEDQAIKELERQFKFNKRIKKMKIIKNTEEIIDLS